MPPSRLQSPPTRCGSHPHFWLISHLSTLLPTLWLLCPPSWPLYNPQLIPLRGLCKSCAFCLECFLPSPPKDGHINDFVSWSKTLLMAPLFRKSLPWLISCKHYSITLGPSCCFPSFTASIVIWCFLAYLLPGFFQDIPHSLRAGTLSDSLITVSPDTPQMLDKYLADQWSLLLLGKTLPKVPFSISAFKKVLSVIFFMVLWLIRKYILKPILPPFNQEIFTVPNAFAIQRKMRQQIHNSVTENDMKMTKYNTNYDQTTKRPTNITKCNRDQE